MTEILSDEAVAFVTDLNRRFRPRRDELLAARRERSDPEPPRRPHPLPPRSAPVPMAAPRPRPTSSARLAHLRNGDTDTRLASGFQISVSTAWRCRATAIVQAILVLQHVEANR